MASLESYRGRLRIHLPRAWYPNQSNKYLTLGLVDTLANRELANRKLAWIQGELDNRTFDVTLNRYCDREKSESYLQVVSNSAPKTTLKQIWDSYLNYLKPIRKESTIHGLVTRVSPKVDACPVKSPYDAIEIRNWLLENCTRDTIKRILEQLNAACKWAIQHKRLSTNISPFEGMAQEFQTKKEFKANAFTLDDRDRVLSAFAQNRYYKHYTNFVEFLLLTGCRPSEAVGLEWSDIKDSYILFDGGITVSGGKRFSSKGKGSKNNKIRKFPINQRLRELLNSLVSTHPKYVFPSPKGTFINYDNFCKRAWAEVVDSIKPNTTPYCCRDTFITEQIAKGVNPAIIAKWSDNSVKMIEKHYLDMASIDHILPQ